MYVQNHSHKCYPPHFSGINSIYSFHQKKTQIFFQSKVYIQTFAPPGGTPDDYYWDMKDVPYLS